MKILYTSACVLFLEKSRQPTKTTLRAFFRQPSRKWRYPVLWLVCQSWLPRVCHAAGARHCALPSYLASRGKNLRQTRFRAQASFLLIPETCVETHSLFSRLWQQLRAQMKICADI